ncbi:MAG: DUF480 domain-containing protein [Deltaproteobacteria bacterium]|nr:DUF480 domain-containing protein [Deltaproteobacteria bacterium]
MDILLTQEEIRVLGCLMEKEMATPEYYPLSINALVSACNQKSNRDPVTSYPEDTVVKALEGLRQKSCAMESSGSRVQRYAQTFSRLYNLKRSEEAIMCILFVRGAQTNGEIRSRTGRLYHFADLEELQGVVSDLERVGLVKALPKQPGKKECRYTHLLQGDPLVQLDEAYAIGNVQVNEIEQVGSFKDEVAMLRRELRHLKEEFEAFKAQFK